MLCIPIYLQPRGRIGRAILPTDALQTLLKQLYFAVTIDPQFIIGKLV
jgi:hypothetical protein